MFNNIEHCISAIISDVTLPIIVKTTFLAYFYFISVLPFIHEVGHAIVITFYSFIKGLSLNTCIIIKISCFSTSKGKTYAESYKNIEGHTRAIKLNAIAGIIAESLFTIFSVYLLFYSKLPEVYHLLYAAAIIVPFSLSFINTICKGKHNPNNDIYIFKHPEQFKYNPDA